MGVDELGGGSQPSLELSICVASVMQMSLRALRKFQSPRFVRRNSS